MGNEGRVDQGVAPILCTNIWFGNHLLVPVVQILSSNPEVDTLQQDGRGLAWQT